MRACSKARCDGVAGVLEARYQLRVVREAGGVLDQVKGPLDERAGYAALDLLCAPRRSSRVEAQGIGVAGPLLTRSSKLEPQPKNALKGAKKGTSHGPYCDRSWWQGIADLRALCRWHDCRRVPLPDRALGQVPQKETSQPRHPGDVRRNVQGR